MGATAERGLVARVLINLCGGHGTVVRSPPDPPDVLRAKNRTAEYMGWYAGVPLLCYLDVTRQIVALFYRRVRVRANPFIVLL